MNKELEQLKILEEILLDEDISDGNENDIQ